MTARSDDSRTARRNLGRGTRQRAPSPAGCAGPGLRFAWIGALSKGTTRHEPGRWVSTRTRSWAPSAELGHATGGPSALSRRKADRGVLEQPRSDPQRADGMSPRAGHRRQGPLRPRRSYRSQGVGRSGRSTRRTSFAISRVENTIGTDLHHETNVIRDDEIHFHTRRRYAHPDIGGAADREWKSNSGLSGRRPVIADAASPDSRHKG